MKIVPATAEHLKALYEELPGPTIKAVAVVDGDRVLGIGGTYVTNGNTIIFTKMVEELKSNKRVIIRAARMIMSTLSDRAFAICDPKVETSPGFLLHFGFEPIGNGIWQTR